MSNNKPKSNSEIRDCQETNIITKVETSPESDYYTISMGAMCFGLDKAHGYEPSIGEEITIHTKGGSFGTIRGVDIKEKNVSWKRVFWKTDEELDEDHRLWVEKYEKEKQERYLKEVDSMDAQYNALPDFFKKRIDRFRKNNDRFRVDYESYELFCCNEAVIIANACKDFETVEKFSKMNYNEQYDMIPEMSHDHSGNTIGCAISLAYWYLKEPEVIEKIHGALSPLVGGEAYGDVPKKDE
jgi:hypothetical protein